MIDCYTKVILARFASILRYRNSLIQSIRESRYIVLILIAKYTVLQVKRIQFTASKWDLFD